MDLKSVRVAVGRRKNLLPVARVSTCGHSQWDQGMLKGQLYSLPYRNPEKDQHRPDNTLTVLRPSHYSISISPFSLPSEQRSPSCDEEISVISVDLLRNDRLKCNFQIGARGSPLGTLPVLVEPGRRGKGRKDTFARRTKPHFSQPVSLCHSPKSGVKDGLDNIESSPVLSGSTDDREIVPQKSLFLDDWDGKEEQFRRVRYPASVSPVRNAFGLERKTDQRQSETTEVTRECSFEEIDRFLKRLKEEPSGEQYDTRISDASPPCRKRHRKQYSLGINFPREIFGGRSMRRRPL